MRTRISRRQKKPNRCRHANAESCDAPHFWCPDCGSLRYAGQREWHPPRLWDYSGENRTWPAGSWNKAWKASQHLTTKLPTTDRELLKGLRESFNNRSGKATFRVYNGDFERLMAMAERGIRRAKTCCSPVTNNPAEDATYAKIEADTHDKAPKRKYPPFESTER